MGKASNGYLMSVVVGGYFPHALAVSSTLA